MAKWIPVSKRLPKKDGSYLVCTKNNGILLTRFYTNGRRFSSTRISNLVVAWQPLPKPYKEAQDERTD